MGDREEVINENGGRLVGLYYKDLNTTGSETVDLAAVNKKMNSFRWDTGYRIMESAESHIYNGGMLTATPTVFVIDTHLMQIVAVEPPASINVVNLVKEINEKYPTE